MSAKRTYTQKNLRLGLTDYSEPDILVLVLERDSLVYNSSKMAHSLIWVDHLCVLNQCTLLAYAIVVKQVIMANIRVTYDTLSELDHG